MHYFTELQCIVVLIESCEIRAFFSVTTFLLRILKCVLKSRSDRLGATKKYYLGHDTRGVQFTYVVGTQVALLCTSEAPPPYFLEIV